MFGCFDKNRTAIEEQYRQTRWNEASGLPEEELIQAVFALDERLESEGHSKEIIKARLFEYVMDNAHLAAQPEDFFQDHILHGFALQKVREKWIAAVVNGDLRALWEERNALYRDGVGSACYDFGHTVPDWYDVQALGLPGLLARVEAAHTSAASLTREQDDFYTACEIVYRSAMRYCLRLAAECKRVAAACEKGDDADRLRFCADALKNLTVRAPETLHEALQLAYIFHILQEEIEGERLRSLGGLDRIYRCFYEDDIASGRFTKAQISELWQNFFQKFHALTGDQLFGEPMYLGGTLPGGDCAVNELSYLILDSYDRLDIANPKFHIRISKNTPRAFIRCVCECIRGGNSSFVFVSDECAIPMMMKVGATEDEAREYVPIGCYEPGILGREVACTGNGGFSLPKMLELALHDGIDPLTGRQIGLRTGDPADFDTFDDLKNAVLAQMKFFMRKTTDTVIELEKHYMRMNPSPLFSATLRECVESGKDAYAGGAKYNNSSAYMYSNATLVDSLVMIDKFVYRTHEYTLPEFIGILDSDWEGHEALRLRALRDEDKWGNDRDLPDALCVELCEEVARYGNSIQNGRGGRFKVAMYTIDFNRFYGEHTGATADGRKAGQILSRNLGASSGMDRCGVTSLMRSCTKLDLTEFPTGTVLDIMLHPTAVAGEEGLGAFAALILSYMEMGGYAIHGNVFDAAVLRAAQREPDRYKNLQVRVCGWNVYFVNLSRAEQEEFIRRAELAQAG
ncbi:MAG: pyruvate formate lyase family protein [Christensenellales bacterium]|jgi:pyruvate-formate lyase